MVRVVRNATVALTGGQSDLVSEAKQGERRVVLAITNLNAAGGAACYLSAGEEAAANKGIQLAAGQTIIFSQDAGYTPFQGIWSGYAAAGMNLAVYEEIETGGA